MSNTTASNVSYKHIAAGQATTVVKPGPGTLFAVIFNGPATATNVTTIYDNTAASGNVVAIPVATGAVVGSALNFGNMGIRCNTGITIATTTANGCDMTVVYA